MKKKLYCPLRYTTVGCLKPAYRIGRDNPPFEYTPDDAIKKIVCHLYNDHSLQDLIIFFEEYLSGELLEMPLQSPLLKEPSKGEK